MVLHRPLLGKMFDTELRRVTSCLRTMKHLLQVMQKGRLVVGCCGRRIVDPIAVQQPKPNTLFILPDNIGWATLAPKLAAHCAARQRHAVIASPQKASG